MADQLGRLQGRFILSINDTDEIRETFAGFKMEPVSVTYTVGAGNGVKAKELIISG